MSIRSIPVRRKVSRAWLFSLTVFLFTIISGGVLATQAQQRVSKRYVTGKNVRIELRNISGTIIVESWNRDEIKLSATMESPKALVYPKQMDQSLIIDVIGDNRGRADVGDVNFKLQVPVNSSVDLETRRGQISVSNIRGASVRAHVSSEGDIELTGISAVQVMAQNTIGNIFFDGDFSRGGTYEFKSSKGDITIRIPGDSAFKLVANSPTRKITLGEFWNNNFKTLGDGRKFVGDVGDGRASVSVTNFSGGITFMRR
ncbi:MAG TPA: DUF4097 family beta strand repeat-containing protein [Pyrinomonadaceae bacterium]|nr:DUF4097 family beta strand repeat-containing protein [Pyrinomonadaceae bacterium]